MSRSALTHRGSTDRWRRIRSLVLARDGYACQVVVNGRPCLELATVCGHITPRAAWPAGMPGIDDGSNLRAECRRHSNSGGGYVRRDRDRQGREAIRRLAEIEQWPRPEPYGSRPQPAASKSPVESGDLPTTPTAPMRVVGVDPAPSDEDPQVF